MTRAANGTPGFRAENWKETQLFFQIENASVRFDLYLPYSCYPAELSGLMDVLIYFTL